MAPEVLPSPSTNVDKMASAAIATFSPADAGIEDLRQRYMPLVVQGVEDRDGLRSVHDARMIVKAHRVAIEKTRKELKAGALEYGRRVDAEAKRLTALIDPIESHLQAEEDRIAEEKAAIKAEEERKRKAKLDERVAAFAAVGYAAQVSLVDAMSDEDFEVQLAWRTEQHQERQAQEAEERAQREAEEAAERERVEKERAELERLRAEQAEREERAAKARKAEEQRLAQERAAIEADRRKVEEERQAIERERELERAKREAAEQAKREAEEKVQRAGFSAASRERARKAEEAAQPEAEKLRTLADTVAALVIAPVREETAERVRQILLEAAEAIRELAEEIGL